MLTEVVKKYAGGTVLLAKRDDANSVFHPIGSAFLCYRGGYLLTAAHVFSIGTPLCVVVFAESGGFQPLTVGEAQVAPVEIRQYDAINDVALLKVVSGLASSVPEGIFGSDESVELGALSACMGYPFSDAGLHVRHVSSAMISAKVLSKQNTRQYQLDTMAHEGCSGGPLIDVRSGKIIGIMAGRFSPIGNGAGIMIGNRTLGTDSAISFATCIQHGLALLREEKLNV